MAYRFRIAVIAPYSFRFAWLLRVSGVVGGEFEKNILETEADAFQLIKWPAFLDDFGGNRAANVFALGGLDRCQYVPLHRRCFNLYTAGARNLREQLAQRLLGCLDFRADALATLELRCEILRRIDGCNFAFVDDDHTIARHAHFGQNVR